LPSPKRMKKARARAKEVRKEVRRRLRNRAGRSESRTLVAKARAAIESGQIDEAAAALPRALARLDTAASKGILHKRNAARRKSRLMARFNAEFPGEALSSAAGKTS